MKDLLLHNWHLKLISLAAATMLWAQVARTPSAEKVVSVPLEYQNIPPQTDVFGDMNDRVEVRLRGPSSLLRTLSAPDVSLSIDVGGMTVGQEKVLLLTPELVRAPFGVEVIRVIPSSARLTVEPTETKRIRIVPTLSGPPEEGFELTRVLLNPEMVEIEGPASHIKVVETIPTTTIDMRGKKSSFKQTVDLDILDRAIRAPRSGAITVDVRIRPQAK
jgi:YbbR domain-containing protein